MEIFGDGLEAVVAAATAFGAVAETVERKIEVVADDEDVFEGDFVEIGEFGDGATRVVVKSLGFDEDFVAGFQPEGVELGLLPGFEVVNFGIKIEGEEAEVVAGEVVFWARVAEADDEFHISDYIIDRIRNMLRLASPKD